MDVNYEYYMNFARKNWIMEAGKKTMSFRLPEMNETKIIKIKICDVIPSQEAFDSLLRYIYYGDTEMPPEDSLYLFQAPIFYGFSNNRLQVFCKQNLETNVTYRNVIPILQASDKMGSTDIKNYALRMIVHNFSKVARLPAMKLLSRPLLLDLVETLAEELSGPDARPTLCYDMLFRVSDD